MTAATPDTTPPRFTAATVPTQPVAPAGGEPPAGATPWYRRAWVLAAGAVLLAVLSFGSGFVAGNVASAFRELLGGPGTGLIERGHGLPGGVLPGDGDGDGDRPRPGSTSSQDVD